VALKPGTTIAGRYRADLLLRRGGMGEVWRCTDLDHHRPVAVKAIRPEFLREAWAARLFRAEVVAVARLNHPGIVPVYDLLSAANGATYLVMELREGRPLADFVREAPPWRFVRAVLEQVLSALAYAHSRGTLHLDVKPDNVLVAQHGDAVSATLLDFGIARVRRPGTGIERWLDEDIILGTVGYMAPEQCTASVARLGPWTDLYGVGAMAYELCAGRTPFADPDPAASISRRMQLSAPPLHARTSDVPTAFADLVAWLLETHPRHRPFQAADVLHALHEADRGKPGVARPYVAPDVAVEGSPTTRVDYALGFVKTMASSLPDLGPPTASPYAEGTAPSAGAATRQAPSSSARAAVASAAFTAEETPPPSGAYGLFGLRDLPVLGRPDERRAVWAAVYAAVLEHRPRLVTLEGPAGVGKSRLARDAIERAAELGLGFGMQTSWSADGSGDEGLRGLLENLLDTSGASAGEMRERLAFWLERVPGEHAAFVRDVELLLRPPAGAAPDAGLPLRAATGAIARAATLAPIVLWLDDVHFSRGEALALVTALEARSPSLPVCVIATVRSDEIADRQGFEALAARGVRVRMERLGADASRQLVRGLLEVDDDLCELLAARAEGNPLFATELLRHLVDGQALERRDGRYRLAREFDLAAVPRDIGAVWERRLGHLGGGRRELAALALTRDRVSLELAGWLGSVLGPELDEAITRALGAGLLHVEDGVYVWTHGLLREHLVRNIAPADAPALHAAAATALAPLVGREDVQEERARHLRGAGHGDEACAAMLDAGLWSMRRDEKIARRLRFETLVSWAHEATLSGHEARALAELAYLDVEAGQGHRADARLAEARAIAQGEAAAWVAMRTSQIARLQGRTDEGMRATQEALRLARDTGAVAVERLALQQLALDALRAWDLDTARNHFQVALEMCRAHGDSAGEAQVLSLLARTDPAKARSLCEQAMAVAREAGAMRAELGARQMWVDYMWRDGERDRARVEAKALAEEAARRSQRQNVSLLELQCTLWAISEGDWIDARAHRDLAAKWGAATGAVSERVYLHALDTAIAAHAGDLEAARRAYAEFCAERGSYEDPELRELFRRAATLAPALAGELDI
jgi:hypothetical protein